LRVAADPERGGAMAAAARLGSPGEIEMTDRKDMSDPAVRPPFWRHRYYYLALKVIVLIAAVLLALRLIGLG
jgi:hypothetical protein